MSTVLKVYDGDRENADREPNLSMSYCKATGATKTGTVSMLLQILKDEHLLAIVRKTLTVN